MIPLSRTVWTQEEIDYPHNFRLKRLKALKDNHISISWSDRPLIMIHLVPLAALNGGSGIDISTAEATFENTSSLLTYRANQHGYGGYHISLKQCQQLFYEGCLERIESLEDWWDQKKIPISALEFSILRCIRDFSTVFQTLKISPPVYVLLSLVNVKNWKLLGYANGIQATKDKILLPATVIEEWASNWYKELLPLFENLWNALGTLRPLNVWEVEDHEQMFCSDENKKRASWK